MAKDDRKAVTRARIVSASVELFGRRGFDGATVQAVADRAGVSPAAVHWHFGAKADLYAEAAQRAADAFLADMRAGGRAPFAALVVRWIAEMRGSSAPARLLRGLSGHLGNRAAARAAVRVNARFVEYWGDWFRERAGRECGGPDAERHPGALVVALLTGLAATAGDGGGDASALLEDLPHLVAFVGEDGSVGVRPRDGVPGLR